MTNPITLPIGPGMTFKVGATEYKLTDHNRSEISIGKDRIENRKRMADATMRSFVVANKRSYKVSWEWLPREDNQTCDGFWGAKSLIDFHDATNGAFQLILTYGDSTEETRTVFFSDFNSVLRKRSKYTDLYDVDLSLEEA